MFGGILSLVHPAAAEVSDVSKGSKSQYVEHKSTVLAFTYSLEYCGLGKNACTS